MSEHAIWQIAFSRFWPTGNLLCFCYIFLWRFYQFPQNWPPPKNISTKRHQIDCFQEVSRVTGSGRVFFRFPTMKIERTGMIDFTIWGIGIFVFQNRFFLCVCYKFLSNFINFPKIDRFRKIASIKRNQIDTVLCMFPSGRVGPGRVVYRFPTINSKHASRAIIFKNHDQLYEYSTLRIVNLNQ